MNAVQFKAGLDHYGWKRDPVDHVQDKALPDDPFPVHAVVNESRWRQPADEAAAREPFFPERYDYRDSLCGRTIKVVLAVDFNPADPDACEPCVAAFERGASGPPPGRSVDERTMAAFVHADRRAAELAQTFDELHPEDPADESR